MSLAAYKARIRQPPHALVSSLFLCHRLFFPMDLIHLLDSKGVAAVTFGSVLIWLLADPRLGATREARLETTNARRLAHYNARPGAMRLPVIYLNNVTRDGWANLSGPAYKAASMRGPAPFVR